MLKNTIKIAVFLAQFPIAGLAQEALPTELVLTTRGELEQTYLQGGGDMRLGSGPMWDAFDRVLILARRPGGAVFARGCEDVAPALTPVSIPSGYSLASVFDLLTGSYMTHNWSVRDGVVNLLPKGIFRLSSMFASTIFRGTRPTRQATT